MNEIIKRETPAVAVYEERDPFKVYRHPASRDPIKHLSNTRWHLMMKLSFNLALSVLNSAAQPVVNTSGAIVDRYHLPLTLRPRGTR